MSMTERNEKGGAWSGKDLTDIVNKLAEYEDAEEQGLLLRLPCRIGTTIYHTQWFDSINESVIIDGKVFFRTERKYKVSKSTFSVLDIEEFGKTVFLTKEEAESALAEKGGAV